MTRAPLHSIAFGLYQILWTVSIPFLRYNHRLAEGYNQRCLKHQHLRQAELWIQCASAGEAYLAWEILKIIALGRPLRVFLTTNTSQGMGILEQIESDLKGSNHRLTIQSAYFPFDSPAIMKRAVRLVRPRLMVLLETELWPGLLSSLKRAGCPVVVINGRMTRRSLDRYMIWPSFWRQQRPDNVLAISATDKTHFAALFGSRGVASMPNIKFDRLREDDPPSDSLAAFADNSQVLDKFLVLGSVRKTEEEDVMAIIRRVLDRQPDAVIGLFPRHMHRIAHWQQKLQRLGISWKLRSKHHTVVAGGVVLWDVFGELGFAYSLATAAFVGGSLTRLGGQNFLEPLVRGIPTVIGPSWENFKWVGTQIVKQEILHQADSWKDVADFLIARIMSPVDRDALKKEAHQYIKDRQGGTVIACALIRKHLDPLPRSWSI
jgi:3-deoxy-D-manno-octulosonic-acid transferase